MEQALIPFLSTLFGAIIGASASIVTTYLSSRSQLSIQKNNDTFQREERMRGFQRDTLIQIQDQFMNLMRLSGETYSYLRQKETETNKWGETLLPDSLSNELRLVNANLTLLFERISNDSLRDELKSVRTQFGQLILATSKQEADHIMSNAVNQSLKLMQQVGKELRANY